MIRLSRRQIGLAAIGAVVVIGLIIGIATHHSKPAPVPIASKTPASTPVVAVNNRDILENKVSGTELSSIQESLYEKAARDLGHNPGTTTAASIRQGSITSQPGTDTITFMVDIPSIQHSYLVEVNDDEESDYHAIYILCPDQTQLIYPAFNCVDEE